MQTSKTNPNCDGWRCRKPAGEVRLVPCGGGGNAILCRACYLHEMAWRRQRNRELDEGCRFDLPSWDELTIYKGGE